MASRDIALFSRRRRRVEPAETSAFPALPAAAPGLHIVANMFATRALLGNPVKVPWRTGLLWKPQKWTQTRKRNWRHRIAKTQDVESVLRQAAGDEARVSGELRKRGGL